MSIVSKVAKFTIRAILSSLAKEAAAADRKAKYVIAKRDSKVATLDKEIVAMANREDAIINKIRRDAEANVRNVLHAKRKRMNRKLDIRWKAGAEVRELDKKGQDALTLKAKLEAVIK